MPLVHALELDDAAGRSGRDAKVTRAALVAPEDLRAVGLITTSTKTRGTVSFRIQVYHITGESNARSDIVDLAITLLDKVGEHLARVIRDIALVLPKRERRAVVRLGGEALLRRRDVDMACDNNRPVSFLVWEPLRRPDKECE